MTKAMQRKSVRWLIVSILVLLLLTGRAILDIMSVPAAHATDIGDNYPSPWRSDPIDSDVDTWGYLNRECTSWTAWALHDRNGFEMPRAIGNGAAWGAWATVHGYTVNSTPSVGAVAWWGANTLDNGYNVGAYGHVAWVSAVSGSSATIEEYNQVVNGVPDGAYHTRTITASATEQVQYIHFRDINTSVATGASSEALVTPTGNPHIYPLRVDGVIKEVE